MLAAAITIITKFCDRLICLIFSLTDFYICMYLHTKKAASTEIRQLMKQKYIHTYVYILLFLFNLDPKVWKILY